MHVPRITGTITGMENVRCYQSPRKTIALSWNERQPHLQICDPLFLLADAFRVSFPARQFVVISQIDRAHKRRKAPAGQQCALQHAMVRPARNRKRAQESNFPTFIQIVSI
jgi:hypothetical protein